MTKLTLTTLLLALFGISNISNAQIQITLPYFTGFDSQPEQSGWVEHTQFSKNQDKSLSHWGFSIGGMSNSKCAYHSFAPSSGDTLTDNWFVSPEFLIPGGGKLDSIRYRFSGYSTPGSNDTIALYLLYSLPISGQPSSKNLLYDFRAANYINDDTFRILTNINLPASNQPCYLALRYRNSNASVNWLAVGFDNIAISGSPLGNDHSSETENIIDISPNPSHDILNISLNNQDEFELRIINILGQEFLKRKVSGFQKVDVSDFQDGVYFVQLKNGNRTYCKRFIKE